MRPLPTLVFAFAACGALLAEAPSNSPQEAFSRSRWIAEHSATAHFDGGLLGSTRESIAESDTARLAPARRRPTPEGPPNVRMSEDILEPDEASGGQPETEAEVSLAADPANEAHLVAGYQEDRFENGGARALTFAVSSDGGRHWGEGLLPALTRLTGGSFERASDPWVAFGTGTRVHYATIAFNETNPDNEVTLSTSEDGGQSWGAPVVVHVNHSRDFDDKEAVVADLATNSPYQGRIYVAWDTVFTDNRQVLRIAHSADDGASFSAPVEVWSGGQNLNALPLVGPDGVVHLIWMSFVQNTIQILTSRSEDGGETWSSPVTVGELRSHGVDGMRTGQLVAAAIDPRRGGLFVTWPDERFTPGVDQIVLATSWDGIGWSAPMRVSDGPDDAPAFTPAVAVNGQGHFGIAYSTFRNDPQRRFLADQYLVTTNSRGRLLGASRVSTHSYDIRNAALSRGFFLGDYQGLVAGQKTFRPVWVATYEDSRLREGKQPDVVTLRIP